MGPISELWVPDSARHLLNGSRGSRDLSDAEKLDRLGRGMLGPRNQRQANDPAMGEMEKNRRVNGRMARAMERTGSYTSPGASGWSGGGGVQMATGRPMDPMFYWKNSGIPYEIERPEELQRIRELARILYLIHPLIASAIDIYSKYPLSGMELSCKDNSLTDFYTDLFFDQLNYEEFLPEVLNRYWIDGEAWPFGSFNELLGVWEDDELLMPEDIEVQRSPFLKDPRLLMKLPQTLRKIIQTRQPAWEYESLARSYPELIQFAADDGERAYLNVSNVLLKQLRFKAGSPNFSRGVPILLRGFRHVIQEQKLNAAVDAIADRLYTPLVLATLGASATDLGVSQPWIPTEEDMNDYADRLDAAMAADFRVLISHFATKMETVFGRESVPNLDADFDRLAEAELQVFGMSKTMLSGAGQGETYAADSINRDLVTQLLGTAQRLVKRLFRERALVVAEAQGHFDYEERGGKRYPIMEEVIEEDEETGEKRIVQQPKLLVPELKIKAMNMKDEAQHQQFVEALRAGGVPISIKTRFVNVPIDLDEEIERVREEQVKLALENQRTRKEIYQRLRAEGLPIPPDLILDFEPKALGAEKGEKVDEQSPPSLGTTEVAPTDTLVPTSGDVEKAVDEGGQVPDEAISAQPKVVQLPRNRTRPVESDEQRDSMPKAASLEEAHLVRDYDEEGTLIERPYAYLTDGPASLGHWRRQSRLGKFDANKTVDENLGIAVETVPEAS